MQALVRRRASAGRAWAAQGRAGLGRWAGALGARRQARQACVGAGRGARGVRGRAG